MRSPAARSILALAALLAAPGALADSRYFSDLSGMRVDEAISELGQRGYRLVGTEQEEGSTLRYFWDSRKQDCAVLSARDGKVRKVSGVSKDACRSMDKGGHGNSGRYDNRDDDRYGYGGGYGGGQLPREITGLVGNKRDDAEGKLAGLGFRKLDGDQSHGRTSSLWWNRSRGECLSVESKDGRVRDISREPRSSCD